jgi:hypothetical protein
VTTLTHVTLHTGRRSVARRSEVSDAVVDALRPCVGKRGACNGFQFAFPDGLQVESGLSGFVIGDCLDQPVVHCLLCWSSKVSEREVVPVLGKTAVPPVPWLAVTFYTAGLIELTQRDPRRVSMLMPVERAIAWAVLDAAGVVGGGHSPSGAAA